MATPEDPPRAGDRRPLAFLISVAFGAVGLVLLLVGLAAGNEVVTLCGVAGGAISLISALVWREELIVAWHAQRERRRQP
jgi:hypothetical protein